jgi:hypothetical protein
MKKSRCVVCQVHNEPVFFPVWLRYYSRYFAPENIYVIHLLKPKVVPFDSWLTSQTGFVRLPTPDVQITDFQAVVNRVQDLQEKLLQEYDSFLFAEVDEFIAHIDGLDNYISNWDGELRRTYGYELIHHYESEPEIDFSKSVLSQRGWWWKDALYDKPLLVREPLRYWYGFHHAFGREATQADQNLFLIHLRRVDYNLACARALERQRNEDDSEYTKKKVELGESSPGWQHWLDSFQIKQWFDLARQHESEIPEFIKKIEI